MNKIQKAIEFAKEKHKGQLRDDGRDYFTAHLEKVGRMLELLTDNEDIISAGYLHDVIEDTDVTYEELVKEFGVTVSDLVMEVTDEGEKDNYGKYFPRLKTKEGILIKFCDRASNISDMEEWSEKRQQHYLNKSKFWKDGKDLLCEKCTRKKSHSWKLTGIHYTFSGCYVSTGNCSICKVYSELFQYEVIKK